ncbi:MAG TPA: pilus assembly protein TadG-related protein [Candidatus Dormibacteraeota bacterium]|nr:pilus assembly protein TadG-related protein [Candidatus Dormibacteraeota bacterium]
MPESLGLPAPASSSTPSPADDPDHRQRGQVLAVFAASIVLFVAILAIVVDVSWYWSNSLKVQRAADAAALAGVVWLPGNVSQGVTVARAEAVKNGYRNGVGGVVVTPTQDGSNPRQMDVTLSAPVNTFFMRLFGINTITATRSSKAEYVLPVPMGSPQNYYGVFGKVRHPGGGITTSTDHPGVMGPAAPTANHSPNNWTNPGNGWASDNVYATVNTTGAQQGWDDFRLTGFPGGVIFDGIQVDIEAKSSPAGCDLQVALSWNDGGSWTSSDTISNLTTTDQVRSAGDPTDLWGRSWTASQFSDANFVVRVTDGGTCGGHTTSVDQVQVEVAYHTTSTTFTPDSDLRDPYGSALAPQGFWGTMINQGAENVNGDAFLPRYDDRSPFTSNPNYAPNSFYEYDVEMPAGTSNGELWIYDPVFCGSDGSGQYGTGDRWFSGNAATSAFYDLYDTKLTQDEGDDTLVASSGNLFRRIQAADADLYDGGPPSGVGDCSVGATSNQNDGRYWHLRWWRIASGLQGGKIYRLHTTTTDSASPNDQNNADGHNSFALWGRATGGLPRIYGVGTMEAFSPLDGGGASIFYLAQIDRIHAGKTMMINLWDPGDTGNLSAALRILQPTSSGYTPATFSWTSQRGTTNSAAANCNGRSGSHVTSVTTNTGGSSVFNGCWVTITIPLPTTYNAPTPPGEPGGGWWKIEYDMGGSTSDNAFDLTTWQVSLRGNPVHLVVP